MTVQTPSISDVPKKDRQKLLYLLHERESLSYSFSYKKLMKVLTDGAGIDEADAVELLGSCIVARTGEEAEVVKKELNEKISQLLTDNDLIAVRSPDPWGRLMDTVIYTSRSGGRFSASAAVEVGPSMGISTEKVLALIAKSTSEGKEYTTLKVAPVKEGKGDGGK